MRNPEILIARVLTPLLAVTTGFIALRGIYVDAQPETQKARMVESVVEQYFGRDGCLTDGPYDDRDGVRDNIKVTEVGMPASTIIDIHPDRSNTDVLHLQLVGTSDGGVEWGFADVVTASNLLQADCKVQDGK